MKTLVLRISFLVLAGLLAACAPQPAEEEGIPNEILSVRESGFEWWTTLLAPEDGACLSTRIVEFRWKTIPGALGYKLLLWRLPEGKTDYYDAVAYKSVETTRTSARLILGTAGYFWAVSVKTPTDYSGWSPWSFWLGNACPS